MSSGDARYDGELNLKWIVWTGVGLAALLVVTAVLMWPLAGALRDVATRLDPPPPVLPEARRQAPPDGPRLQVDPEGELVALRAEEEAELGGWAWIDESAGVARIPIERALEIVAAHGLPAAEIAAPGAAEAPGAASDGPGSEAAEEAAAGGAGTEGGTGSGSGRGSQAAAAPGTEVRP